MFTFHEITCMDVSKRKVIVYRVFIARSCSLKAIHFVQWHWKISLLLMDDPNRLMHPVPGGQVGLMHQPPYGLPPVNVGVNVGVNMASLDGGNQDSENMTGRKQVCTIPFQKFFFLLVKSLVLGYWRNSATDHEHHRPESWWSPSTQAYPELSSHETCFVFCLVWNQRENW